MSPHPALPNGPFARLGHWCGRRRWPVMITWLVLLVVGAVFAMRAADQLTPGGFEISGSSSDIARTTIAEKFTADFPSSVTVTIDGRGASAAAVLATVDAVEAAVRDDPLVGGVTGPRQDPALLAEGGRVAFVEVGLNKGLDQALNDVASVVDAAQGAAQPGVQVEVTGSPAIFNDFNEVNNADLAKSEAVQVPLLILILVLVFGSLIAAGIPIATTVVALVVTLGLVFFIAQVVDLSIYVKNVVPLVGIGVGVDYTLFILTRYREELHSGRTPLEAIQVTSGTAGRAIFFSGLTVVVALAGMFAVGVPIFTGFAFGTIAVVFLAVLVALTLVPAILTALGHRVFKWDVGHRILRAVGLGRRPPVEEQVGRGFWVRWAEWVMDHAWLCVISTAVVLLALASPVLAMRLGSSGITALPKDTTSVRGAELVAEVQGPGAVSPIEVVADFRGQPVDQAAVAALAQAIARDPEVAAVQSKPDVSGDGTVALFNVYAKHIDDAPEAQDLVGRILDDYVPATAAISPALVSVGGGASQNRDFTDTVATNLPWVIGLVMILTFLVLVVLFRSLLLPLKAVVMTLLSVLAAYGVLVMVFQWGYGDSLLGFDHLGHVTNWVPPFLFSILFGLSMDYEVFLLSRVREHREHHGDDREAVAWGLARTGRIISAAALIMIVVFLTFLLNRLIPIKESALGLAVAIFLDATLVRILMVPAFMRLAGKWNWWLPGPLDRVLPRFDEGEIPAAPSR